MPIHLRAQPGDYAPAVLCPGDPRRAEHIAKTFFDGARQVNAERGLLGYTGTFEGHPISVQTSGMGGPSAAIVYEELAQLGARRLVRVGTCGGLQPTLSMADLVVAVSATPFDSVTSTLTGGEPHAPTATFELAVEAGREARARGLRVHTGLVASSDVFYDPDTTRFARLRSCGYLAIEMEAATLYTIAALRGMEALAMMTVSDILAEGGPVRISDDELAQGVETMMAVACRVAVQ
jgi:5'-methylthioadenosine phosphorylase/purine-nucleoside phosphorylase